MRGGTRAEAKRRLKCHSTAGHREGQWSFGPTRARPAVATRKLSRGRTSLPDPPIAGRDRPPRTMSDWWVAPPPSDSATRTSVRRHDLHGRTRLNIRSSAPGCQPPADLRERANPQVRCGRPVAGSSPKISLFGVSAGDTPPPVQTSQALGLDGGGTTTTPVAEVARIGSSSIVAALPPRRTRAQRRCSTSRSRPPRRPVWW